MSEKKNIAASFETTATGNDYNWEMRYMINKFGVTQPEVLEAIKEVGKSRMKVEEYLSAKKQ